MNEGHSLLQIIESLEEHFHIFPALLPKRSDGFLSNFAQPGDSKSWESPDEADII